MSRGRTGRNTATYRKTSAIYRTGQYPCWICKQKPGTTVDHDPPLSTFPHPNLWHGTLKPACPTCQSRQGGKLAQQQRRQKQNKVTSRNW
jgi:hypothetical protein